MNCEDAAKWAEHFDVVKATLSYAASRPYPCVQQKLHPQPEGYAEEWREYKAWVDQLPSEEELDQATAVIIPGRATQPTCIHNHAL